MPKSSSWNDQLKINGSSGKHLALFDDPIAFVKINPTVVDVSPIQGKPYFYKVTERIAMWGMPYRHQFTAKIKKEGDDVISEAWSFPRIHVQTKFVLEEDHLQIFTKLTAPWYIHSFATRAAQKGRVSMLRNLQSQME